MAYFWFLHGVGCCSYCGPILGIVCCSWFNQLTGKPLLMKCFGYFSEYFFHDTAVGNLPLLLVIVSICWHPFFRIMQAFSIQCYPLRPSNGFFLGKSCLNVLVNSLASLNLPRLIPFRTSQANKIRKLMNFVTDRKLQFCALILAPPPKCAWFCSASSLPSVYGVFAICLPCFEKGRSPCILKPSKDKKFSPELHPWCIPTFLFLCWCLEARKNRLLKLVCTGP